MDKDPTYDQSLIVELKRSAGDVVLFLKYENAGATPGDLPTTQDFEAFAETQSSRNRQNYHFHSERIMRKFLRGRVQQPNLPTRERGLSHPGTGDKHPGVCGQDCRSGG